MYNNHYILRKRIYGYLDLVSSLIFNAIKLNLLCMYNIVQDICAIKMDVNLSHASIVKVQYSSKLINLLYFKSQKLKK